MTQPQCVRTIKGDSHGTVLLVEKSLKPGWADMLKHGLKPIKYL